MTPYANVLAVMRSCGSRPAMARPSTGIATIASSKPTQPARAITIDSPRMNPRTRRSGNPMALSTPSSFVRSRTEIAIVFPVTSKSVKKTTVPIETIRNLMFPNCFTQPSANADSVSVLVS